MTKIPYDKAPDYITENNPFGIYKSLDKVN